MGISPRLILMVYILPQYGITTRFLPMIIWDHINPQLSCECNWLVIPHTDVYDQLDFVCPTYKVAAKLLDGYTRPDIEMYENLFRRRWPGTREELRDSIRDGSIHSFCNVSSPETKKLFVCKKGAHTSKSVIITYDSSAEKNYETGRVYIFFNNGNNGRKEMLNSKAVRCTMLFAIYITEEEKVEHDITFGKTALTGACNCDKRRSSCTSTSQASSQAPTQTKPTTIAHSLVQSSTTRRYPSSSLRTRPPSSSPSSISSTLSMLLPQTVQTSPTRNTKASTSYKDPGGTHPTAECKRGWLSTVKFVIAVLVAFVAGVLCTLVFIAVRKRTKNKGGFNNVGYDVQPAKNSPSEQTHWLNEPKQV